MNVKPITPVAQGWRESRVRYLSVFVRICLERGGHLGDWLANVGYG